MVKIVTANQRATIETGELSITVDPAFGGRIQRFSLGGKNILMENCVQTGSTFWPSPQSAWHWPPPPAIDSGPYELEIEDETITMVSGSCGATGLRVRKCIGVAVEGRAVWLEYTMKNVSDRNITVAPWEISRVAGGLSFYKSAEPLLPFSQGDVAVQQAAGCGWYLYEPDKLDQPAKIFAAQSDGWLANINNGLLFLKTFPPIAASQAAPGEAELEIYAHTDHEDPYLELEQQGVYTALSPGESASWTVQWALMPVPGAIAVEPGSEPLLGFVREQLQALR